MKRPRRRSPRLQFLTLTTSRVKALHKTRSKHYTNRYEQKPLETYLAYCDCCVGSDPSLLLNRKPNGHHSLRYRASHMYLTSCLVVNSSCGNFVFVVLRFQRSGKLDYGASHLADGASHLAATLDHQALSKGVRQILQGCHALWERSPRIVHQRLDPLTLYLYATTARRGLAASCPLSPPPGRRSVRRGQYRYAVWQRTLLGSSSRRTSFCRSTRL
jgi:hypothetical protein